MQIPNTTQHTIHTSISFAPPQAGELIQQDNQARSLIAPVAQAEPSQGFDLTKEQPQSTLYTRQGQVSGSEVKADEAEKTADANENTTSESAASKQTDKATDAPAKNKNVAGKELTLEQQEELLQLQSRDQEVRVHEQQHASLGGQHTGFPSYQYETGPDGKQYVVEGSVSVNLSPVAGDPVATIEKMRQVKAAALAPAEPSSADKNAAATADSLISKATAEIMQAREEKLATTADDETVLGSTAISGSETQKAAAKEPTVNTTDNVNAMDSKTTPGGDAHDKAQLEHRNQIIAGVYGKSAQAQSQQLLSLA